ncbi:protein of unknown function [Legionella micdadei]|uniref:Uncharacterized protein n=1 Tax=Legionella micdadei TaxID=451 RepID=A0A098GHK7_LEGMI|nr:protein of unknown function [Legionella micdadei]
MLLNLVLESLIGLVAHQADQYIDINSLEIRFAQITSIILKNY